MHYMPFINSIKSSHTYTVVGKFYVANVKCKCLLLLLQPLCKLFKTCFNLNFQLLLLHQRHCPMVKHRQFNQSDHVTCTEIRKLLALEQSGD